MCWARQDISMLAVKILCYLLVHCRDNAEAPLAVLSRVCFHKSERFCNLGKKRILSDTQASDEGTMV